MPAEEIFIGGVVDQKEQELMEREKQYTQSRMQGISDTKAYGNRRTVKELSTLYRIKLENLAKTNETQRASSEETQKGEERE